MPWQDLIVLDWVPHLLPVVLLQPRLAELLAPWLSSLQFLMSVVVGLVGLELELGIEVGVVAQELLPELLLAHQIAGWAGVGVMLQASDPSWHHLFWSELVVTPH